METETQQLAIQTPAEALWNQRDFLASRTESLSQLVKAVGRPTDLAPFQWSQLIAFALDFQPDVILELGRGWGNSTCCFLEVAEMLRPQKPCKVVSLCLSDDWPKRTLPKLKQLRPPEWFAAGQLLMQDILGADAARLLGDAQRCFVFWDAHGFELAEWVLGHLLPQLADKPHVVAMHDMSDVRYCTPPRNYRECGLWKGEHGGSPGFWMGNVFSRVGQAISITDFAARNRLPLHSADESLHAMQETEPIKVAELEALLGKEFFSLNGHWFWFSLTEANEPITFPRFQAKPQPPQPPLWRRVLDNARRLPKKLVERFLKIGRVTASAEEFCILGPSRLALPSSNVDQETTASSLGISTSTSRLTPAHTTDPGGAAQGSASADSSPMHEPFRAEPTANEISTGYGIECFDTVEALAINRARLEHIEKLSLNLCDKRILDVGCGVGHLGRHFTECGCRVVSVDGREENIAALRQRYSGLEAHHLNVETDLLAPLGRFDLVLCYGLLYHLENPAAALRNCASVCAGSLLLESVVTDHPEPLLMLADETPAANQALNHLGCRPTPSYIIKLLHHVGFPWVYGPVDAPSHPDFQFTWKNNLEHCRDGHLLRSVFLAARAPLANSRLRLLSSAVSASAVQNANADPVGVPT